ncbi:MAG TPA: guanitoxin biosynthesis L-enduracididine beta-hydroxylase GntD [Pyrinomonadaceae bacterium]|nr:guanitoxin biosynthesis L-enduracididine beta-hydroxylase GntD [Pyrinomonadaceae bacterium]
MTRIFLSEDEVDYIRSVLESLQLRLKSAEDDDFLNNACLYAHQLPFRLRKCLNDFKLLESDNAVLMFSGYPIKNERIGLTPTHWNSRPELSPTLEEEMLLILFGSLLGEPLGWATQQNGHIVHDILPIKAHEEEQLGTGSSQTLYWHNEDAFHPYRGDYICILCLRNPDRVATTYVSIDMVEISEAHKKILFERRFVIRPDESHLEKNRGRRPGEMEADDPLLASAYERIRRMNECPPKLAVLFGDPAAPYLRIDPYFMDPLDDQEAQSALDSFVNAIESKLTEVILEPGDVLCIDNYRAVHGRHPFKPQYDGQDRWLKRINVARDIRKSRDARRSPESRIIL